jgi:hypothetical protein
MQSCHVLLLRWCVYLIRLFSFQSVPLKSSLVSLLNDATFQTVSYQWSTSVPEPYFPTQPLCHYHPLFPISPPFLELFLVLLPAYPSSFCCNLPLAILTGWEDFHFDTTVKFPSRFTRNLMDYCFSDCGILSSSLLSFPSKLCWG